MRPHGVSSSYQCRGEGDAPGDEVDVLDDDELDDESQRAIVCSACSHPITSAAQRCSEAGKHLHTFFNPAGIVYEIGCFRAAPGCLVSGPRSREFAWFADCSWQICYCASCLAHLGWYFTGPEKHFFGLIVNRLSEQ